MKKEKNQEKLEVLDDRTKNGKVRDWRDKKTRNIKLSEIYKMIADYYCKLHDEKYDRFLKRERNSRMCATQLTFKLENDGSKRLHEAILCQLRLCPICNWRRSLKIFSHVTKIIEAIESEKEHAYIFLTLTQKNVSGENLDSELDKMMKAWNKFLGYKAVKSVIKGSYRGLEIKYDKEPLITKQMYKLKKEYYQKRGLKVGDKNPNFDMYHPHFHVLICVNKTYFKSKEYLSHEAWQGLWAKAMQLDYLPSVNVKRVKGNSAKAVAEVAKYSTKDEDYVIEKDFNLSANVVEILDYALQRRRLIAFSGNMKEWHKKLNLDDSEDGDLVHIDTDKDEELEQSELKLETYAWNVGYMNYTKV